MAGKLGIVAGGGDLPGRLVQVCRDNQRDVFVVALRGHSDPSVVEQAEHVWVRLGAASDAVEPLRAAGVTELVLAGPIKRPSLVAVSRRFWPMLAGAP